MFIYVYVECILFCNDVNKSLFKVTRQLLLNGQKYKTICTEQFVLNLYWTLYSNWLWFTTVLLYSYTLRNIIIYLWDNVNWPYTIRTEVIFSLATVSHTFINSCLFVSVCGTMVYFMVLFKHGHNCRILIFSLIVSWWPLSNGVW